MTDYPAHERFKRWHNGEVKDQLCYDWEAYLIDEFTALTSQLREYEAVLTKIITAQDNCENCYKTDKDLKAANRGFDRAIKAGRAALSRVGNMKKGVKDV